MNTIWLCITSLLMITSVICDQNIDTTHIRVFPANQSIAGVFQVSHLNHLNQPQYAFNASEARMLCSSLGVNIASKAQVQAALTRGLETCRYGWVDEHFAVIPRSKALLNCGKNQTGVVTWRASVTNKFDVFCFNESDAALQLEDTTTDSPLNGMDHSGETQSPKAANMHPTSSSSLLPSSSSSAKIMDSEAEPSRFVGSAQGPAGAKVILITSTCALLLTAIIIFAYIKMRNISGRKQQQQQQQQEYIETEEWTCVRNIKQTQTAAQEDERIEVGDDAS